MVRFLGVLAACILATGCANAKSVLLPTGETGFRIRCPAQLDPDSGGAAYCQDKAAAACPLGYQIVNADTGTAPGVPRCPGRSDFGLLQYGLWCEILIRCETDGH